jgi:hypothetical protein
MRAAGASRALAAALRRRAGEGAAASTSSTTAAQQASSTSTWAAPDRAATPLAASVRALFESSGPLAASHALVDALGPAHRGVLLRALTAAEAGGGQHAPGGGGGGGVEEEEADGTTTTHPSRLPISQLYADALFTAADTRGPFGSLDREELADALRRHEAATEAAAAGGRRSTSPLTPRTLAALAAAAGLPFIGFGFVDNFIMLAAGEEIEAHFGAALGLSTLAAAGLGNLVSDVCGLGLAESIETRARSTRWGAPPVLSAGDRRKWSVRAARVAGSVGGVSLGCLLGMVPLLWM